MEGQNPTLNGDGDGLDAAKTDVGLPRFPPGFRFNPRDNELVRHYLMRKIAGQPLPYNVINDVTFLDYDPQTLCEKFKGYGEKKWYFFTARDRKYGFGYRPERMTPYGYWKASGVEKMIQFNKATIGRRRSLVFYSMISNKKTDWVMHEYLVYDGHKKPPFLCKSTKRKAPKPPKQLNKWVLCTIRKMQAPKPKKDMKAPKKGTKAKAPKKDNQADDKLNVNTAIIQDQPSADWSGPSSSQPLILDCGSMSMKKKLPKVPKERKRKNCSQKQATGEKDVSGVTPQNYDHQSQGNLMSVNNFDELHSIQKNNLEKMVGDLRHLSYHDLQMLYQQLTNRGHRMDKFTPISGNTMSMHTVSGNTMSMHTVSGNTMSMHTIGQQHTLYETLKDRREVARYPTPIIGNMGTQNLDEQHITHEIANTEQSFRLHPYIPGSGVTTYTAYNYPQPDQSCLLDNNQFGGNTMITQNYDRPDIQQDNSILLSGLTTFVHDDFNYGCLPYSENGTSNTLLNSASYTPDSGLLSEGDILLRAENDQDKGNGVDSFMAYLDEPSFDQHLLEDFFFTIER
ncbi:uncharacterized protein [Typha angustifolia]|uniref:uncharacterized protein n=1 Tax=Typha angustifolia TaxID=59011 RepID=UPI003C305583